MSDTIPCVKPDVKQYFTIIDHSTAMGDEVKNGDTADVSTLSVVDGDFVDPWNVSSTSATGVDYDKLISMLF